MKAEARRVAATRCALALALDTSNPAAAARMADTTRDSVDVLKVGMTLFGSGGPSIVTELAERAPVFLDAKLHDIPAQVEGAVRAAAAAGATYLTVHSSGGAEMVETAVRAAGGDLSILAVTVLTSLDRRSLARTGVPVSVEDQVRLLATLALDAGAPGLVCSPLEVAALRRRFGPRERGGPLLVVPGIRPGGAPADDQRRTMGPRAAAAAGADIIVVGRPITGAADPGAAAARIREELR